METVSCDECTAVRAESHGSVFVHRTVDMNATKGMNDSEWLHHDE